MDIMCAKTVQKLVNLVEHKLNKDKCLKRRTTSPGVCLFIIPVILIQSANTHLKSVVAISGVTCCHGGAISRDDLMGHMRGWGHTTYLVI